MAYNSPMKTLQYDNQSTTTCLPSCTDQKALDTLSYLPHSARSYSYQQRRSTPYGLRSALLAVILLVGMAWFGAMHAAPSAYGTAETSAQRQDSTAQRAALPLSTTVTSRQSSNIHSITANDLFLAGTQPGGLSSNLADSTTCSYCHVDHIVENYAGSMMANSARDPLFRAALQIANQDLPGSGEFCLRCHSPNAWLNGRADGDGADGSKLTSMDLQGVTCTTCHRMVPPSTVSGESTRDAVERAHIVDSFGSTFAGSGAYILDREEYRRGLYQVNAPHAATQTSYMRSAELCGTCHDISNPLLSFDNTSGEFVLNAPNTPAAATDRLFPIERTYSEWAASSFADGGVKGLDYPGLRRATLTNDGPITVCQDCHMPMIQSIMAIGGAEREIGKHQWAGANSRWQRGIWELWKDVAKDTSFNADATYKAATTGAEMLQRAAELELAIVNNYLEVKVINNTGHKLPTGYAEGRRMWLQVTASISETVVYTTGVLVDGTIGGTTKVYEVRQGITPNHALALSNRVPAGESFHFVLNNTVLFDNRIPPRGYTAETFAAADMQPVGYQYAEGQYWDVTRYRVPHDSTKIEVQLLFQSASDDYLDFLERGADFTVADAVLGEVNWGATIGKLRRGLGLDEPEIMATAVITPTFDPTLPDTMLYLPIVVR